MGRRYAAPPLIEAVCELRLTPDTQWDLTIPGMIYEKVKDDFPNREQRLAQEVEIEQGPQGMQQKVRTDERVLLTTENGRSFIQIGSHLLAVNCLKPYPAWAGFKPLIERALQALNTTVKVKGIERAGLRYINRIEIPTHTIKLEEYFDFRPHLGPNLPKRTSGFALQCLLPFSEKDACTVQLSSAVPEEAGNSAILLDLDYFLVQPRAIVLDKALEWIEEAHQRIEEVFEGCITERLRELFQEIK